MGAALWWRCPETVFIYQSPCFKLPKNEKTYASAVSIPRKGKTGVLKWTIRDVQKINNSRTRKGLSK